jgi:periplasmic divalent cation tolerance protein
MTDKIIVLVTCGSVEEAEVIARALVEGRLAACASIVPGVRSIYRWQGAVEDAQEWLLIIKTTREEFERLQAEVRRLHSYELPEIVAIQVAAGFEAYLSWIDESTGRLQ